MDKKKHNVMKFFKLFSPAITFMKKGIKTYYVTKPNSTVYVTKPK